MTELILRLYPLPGRIVAARAVFPDIESAGRAAVAMIRTGMRIGRVELVDSRTVGAVNAYKGTDYAAAPTLFLEFSGSEAGVERRHRSGPRNVRRGRLHFVRVRGR